MKGAATGADSGNAQPEFRERSDVPVSIGNVKSDGVQNRSPPSPVPIVLSHFPPPTEAGGGAHHLEPAARAFPQMPFGECAFLIV